MRVTTNTISSNYLKNLGETAAELQRSRQKASTLRKYLSVEEDPASYVREARIVRDYHKNEDYQETADKAMALLQNQDKIMQAVLDMGRNVSKKYSIEALSDTNAAQRAIYAAQLESLQEAMVRTLNSNDSGDFVFAGADGAKPPFELENGRLYYRGIDVETGRYKDGSLPDPATGAKDLDALKNEKLYFDLGYGLDTNPHTSGVPTGTGSGYYDVKASSVFNASVSGLNAIGWADKYENISLIDSVNAGQYMVPIDKGENIVNLTGKLAKMLRAYDRSQGGYTEFATDESGVLLQDVPGGGRQPMKDATTGTLIYEKNTAVNKDGFLINKFTGNVLLKDAGPPKEYWRESDVAKNTSDWNKTFSNTLKKFDAAYDRVLKTETDIGVRMNFVSVTKDRLNLSEEILTDRFEQVAKITPEKAFTDYSFAMTHYNTALRLGTSIIPKSLAELMPF